MAVAPSGILGRHIRSCDGPGVLEVGVYGRSMPLHLPIGWHLDLGKQDNLMSVELNEMYVEQISIEGHMHDGTTCTEQGS